VKKSLRVVKTSSVTPLTDADYDLMKAKDQKLVIMAETFEIPVKIGVYVNKNTGESFTYIANETVDALLATIQGLVK